MEMAIGIIAILIGIIIAIIPYLRQKYILRPELTIEIIGNGGLSSPLGLSRKNKVTAEGYIDGDNAIRVFELKWKFLIRITNNSDLTAFYPNIYFNPNGPKFKLIDKLNNLQPIKPAEIIEIKAEYKKFEEKAGKERTVVGRDIPDEFEDLGLLLSYQNSKKRNFYTLYDYSASNNKNLFLKRKPKEYKKTSHNTA